MYLYSLNSFDFYWTKIRVVILKDELEEILAREQAV